MPAVPLPILGNAAPHIEGLAEQLAGLLVPINDPRIVARLGAETVVRHEGTLVLAAGERYRTAQGWVQGLRYVRLSPAGDPVGVLNVTLQKRDRTTVAVASNVYVAPTHRRQGVAAELLREALRDHPRLCADAVMSTQGASLTGHAKPAVRPRP